MKKQLIYLNAIIALIFFSCSTDQKNDSQTVANSEVEKVKEMTENAVQSAPPVTTKKYEVKSGIITFETMMEMAGMKIPSKEILYFDDYGMKECKETYKDGKLTESFFSDGKDLYKVIHEQKTAYKSGAAYRGTEMQFNWDEVSQKDKDAGVAKQGAKETVAGKDCETFTFITTTAGMNTSTKYAGWNRILLSIELSSKDMKSTSKAVKVEENASVSPDKFTVPSDYKTQ